MSDVVRNRLTRQITSLSLDKEDLRKLFDILQERANSAAELEYQMHETRQDIDIAQIRRDVDVCKVLHLTVGGAQNKELFGTIEHVFNSPSFPEKVTTVLVSSDLLYRTWYKYSPSNSFKLFIDFTKHKVFDFSFQPSERTPNDSEFEVQGADSTWANGVFHEISSFIDEKSSKFPTIHKGGVYDVLIWLMGIPIGFWGCLKFLNLKLSIFSNHPFLENVFLTYVFFLGLFFLRILFHYIRWVYPMVEYKSRKEKSIIHQIVLGAIILGVATNLIYDILRYFFWN